MDCARGKDHPSLGFYLDEAGRIASAQGRHADAAVLHGRTLALAERALGPSHPSLAAPLLGLGIARSGLGDVAGALLALERAAVLGRSPNADAQVIAEVRLRLAQLLAQRGQKSRARELATQALVLFEAHPGRWEAERKAARALTG
jgi:tetratricopeptide (TPR) repeat protein